MTQTTDERLEQFERAAERAHKAAIEQLRADWPRLTVKNRLTYRGTYCDNFAAASEEATRG